MKPKPDEKDFFSSMGARVKVYLDNQLIDSSVSGRDVENGEMVVFENKLHHLLTLPTPGKHTLKLEFVNGFIEVYVFTFG